VNVKKKKTDKEDFKILETLGSGTYATVYKVQKKVTREIYAMKCLVKENLMFKKEMQSALTERNILKAALHPFIVQLHYAFQSEKYLFFVMDFFAWRRTSILSLEIQSFCREVGEVFRGGDFTGSRLSAFKNESDISGYETGKYTFGC